ncbi:MAG TPA: hypothetical protein VFV42_13100 [Acidimicrobiales bacterium]|nr:hypothetical protein [Acidimicrobiales bacterium]
MLATLLSLLAALAFVAPQQVRTIDEVGASLRSDPVHVDPSAERALDESEADQIRAAVRDAGTPVYVAVLPASVAATPEDGLEQLASAAGLRGTYAVVVGDAFRVTSSVVPDADAIAGAAFQQHRDGGTAAVLEAFVTDVGLAARGGASRGGDTGTEDPDGGEGGSSLLPVVLLGGAGAALYAWSRRRRRAVDRVAQAEFDADAQLLRAELSVLADDVMRLEPEVVTHPEARIDYEAATQRFRAASAALDYADEPVDLVRVERVVREAEYAMSRARAIVRGHEPPPPPAELRQPGRHDEPALDVDEVGRPVYVGAGPFYGGGWFGGGGLFSGLLLGSMLGGGGMFGWGGGWHHDHGGGGDGWGGGDGGFGGFGGGDWGGDVGGGDW